MLKIIDDGKLLSFIKVVSLTRTKKITSFFILSAIRNIKGKKIESDKRLTLGFTYIHSNLRYYSNLPELLVLRFQYSYLSSQFAE